MFFWSRLTGYKVSDCANRLSGGVVLLVRKEIAKFVKQVPIEYDNMIALSISRDLLKTDADIILLGVYIPPIDSPYYKETDIYNGVSMLEDCILDIISSKGDSQFIIFGDLNARTASETITTDTDDLSDLFNVMGKTHNNDSHENHFVRSSADVTVNVFGRYLLQVCNEFDMFIANGISKHNFSGDFTYISNT